MWALGILILIAISISGVRLKTNCNLGIPRLLDPHCGIGNKCNFNGINKWAVKRESCVRKELGLRDFIKITRGPCPKGDKPPCPKLGDKADHQYE